MHHAPAVEVRLLTLLLVHMCSMITLFAFFKLDYLTIESCINLTVAAIYGISNSKVCPLEFKCRYDMIS